MDQPKTARMLQLMQLLSSNVDYTVDDLMEALDTSRRTIYRYIDTFKQAGFAVQNVHGNVWKLATLQNKYGDLSKVVYFSEEEAAIMNRLLDSLDNTNAIKQELRKKLVAVYDFAAVGDFIGREGNSAKIDALNSAINGKKAVLLKNYASSHSKTTKDYSVEPFKLNTNYIDFWAYDLADGINKRFKTDRIGEVEILRNGWAYEYCHEAEALDAFRIHGNDPVHVAIRMDMVARNLLLEEYPMTEKGLRVDGDAFIWEGDVNGMDGVGRFVLGLPDRIEILEGDGIREYLREKSDAFFTLCQKVTKS